MNSKCQGQGMAEFRWQDWILPTLSTSAGLYIFHEGWNGPLSASTTMFDTELCKSSSRRSLHVLKHSHRMTLCSLCLPHLLVILFSSSDVSGTLLSASIKLWEDDFLWHLGRLLEVHPVDSTDAILQSQKRFTALVFTTSLLVALSCYSA